MARILPLSQMRRVTFLGKAQPLQIFVKVTIKQ